MNEIHLIKANQALPLVMALQRSGASVERIAELTNLPLDAVREQHGVIGEYSLWQFVEVGARRENYDFLGYDAAQLNPITTLGEIGGMRLQLAPTLEKVLHHFIAFAVAESNTSDHQLVPTDDGVWFRRTPIFTGKDASWQIELYFIELIIQIVQICAGKDWLPPELGLSARNKACPLPPQWEGIRVTWGTATTDIKIPANVLQLPPKTLLRLPDTELANALGDPLIAAQFSGYVETQILDGRVGLNSAAEELGTSGTTLKRRLQSVGSTYSDIVSQVRFELARRALEQSNDPVNEIAMKLGYEHQANFTRAFKRMAGMSPVEYRAVRKG